MSTPTVTADIQHPSAREAVTRKPTDPFAKYQVVRVFLAEGLDTGVDNQAGTMLDRALQMPGIPQLGSQAPGAAGAICINRATLTIPASDNSCYVLATYENPLPGAPVAFMVSDDTSLTVESTQIHPADKSVMTIPYLAPVLNSAAAAAASGAGAAASAGGGIGTAINSLTKDDPAAAQELYQATLRYSRPIRKVTVTGYVINTNLDPYRAAIGSVNSASWLGYGRGYWRFDELRDDGILFGNIQKIMVALTSRINENWMSWEVFSSPDLGRRVTVRQNDVTGLQNLGYFYGWKSRNGILAAGLYPMADFARMFGFGGGAASGGAY